MTDSIFRLSTNATSLLEDLDPAVLNELRTKFVEQGVPEEAFRPGYRGGSAAAPNQIILQGILQKEYFAVIAVVREGPKLCETIKVQCRKAGDMAFAGSILTAVFGATSVAKNDLLSPLLDFLHMRSVASMILAVFVGLAIVIVPKLADKIGKGIAGDSLVDAVKKIADLSARASTLERKLAIYKESDIPPSEQETVTALIEQSDVVCEEFQRLRLRFA
jgi:hypothetical protein